jgi:hypothetical protein
MVIPITERKLGTVCDWTFVYQRPKEIASGFGHTRYIQGDRFHLHTATAWGLAQVQHGIEPLR